MISGSDARSRRRADADLAMIIITAAMFFFRKGNILISQLLHRSMHMAVSYYRLRRNRPRNLKHKVLSHDDNKESFQKTQTRMQAY
jgi:hypothetical protein